jgi:hypothetical protein
MLQLPPIPAKDTLTPVLASENMDPFVLQQERHLNGDDISVNKTTDNTSTTTSTSTGTDHSRGATSTTSSNQKPLTPSSALFGNDMEMTPVAPLHAVASASATVPDLAPTYENLANNSKTHYMNTDNTVSFNERNNTSNYKSHTASHKSNTSLISPNTSIASTSAKRKRRTQEEEKEQEQTQEQMQKDAQNVDCAVVDSSPTNVSSSPSSQLTNSSRRFSFNKRALSQVSKFHRKSSQISSIHNYPPQQCDSIDKDMDHSKFYQKYRGIMKAKDELPDAALDDLSFEYNYDEKIRAPRMSIVSLISRDSKHSHYQTLQQQQQPQPYSKLNKSKSSNNVVAVQSNLPRKTSAPALLKIHSSSSSSNTLDSLQEEPPVLKGSYQPATYDLTKQLRKLSLSDETDSLTGDTNINTLPEQENHPFTSNYTYTLKSPRKYAVSNESTTSTTSTTSVSPTCQKKIPQRFEPVKQIDEPTKLLDNYIPPVLRPNQKTLLNRPDLIISTQHHPSIHEALETPPSTSSSTSLQPPSGSESMPSSISTPALTPASTATIHSAAILASSNSLSSSKYMEPSHSHWKPNSATDVCENPTCNQRFTLFRRKHHCRHCGGIFCSSCLLNYANLNLLAHYERPDDGYHPYGGILQANLAPVLSQGTVRSANTLNSIGTLNQSIQASTTSKNRGKHLYSKFCKVCPSCYTGWGLFLASDEDYEGKPQILDELVTAANGRNRKESITNNIPSDWNWSSF